MQSGKLKRQEQFQTHYLEWKPVMPDGRLPVICVHGNLSNARIYQWVGELLSSAEAGRARHVVSIDMRGCGDSGMPEEGFTLQHMASDIDAVMTHLNIGKAHFIAYSRGVSYALQYALERPGRVQSLVAGDYPARFTRLDTDWVARVMEDYQEFNSWPQLYEVIAVPAGISREEFDEQKDIYFAEKDGVIRKRYARELPAKLQQDSADVDLTPALDAVKGPVLVLKGSEKGSLLNGDDLEAYGRCRPEVVQVAEAGHDVFEPRRQVKNALLHFFKDLE